MINMKIPSFPGGDRWQTFVEEYIRGEYTPIWRYKCISKYNLNDFLKKYPLSVKVNETK